jgi:UDP-N-acetylglucosamine 2-epimerase (non-hydrolysing)/GDP/UDP-N,N'-diacetylbacillosamine 2-epimerase (hydrolysing)
VSSSPRRVLALTTSRADWGHLSSPLKHLRDRDDIDLQLAVLGAHLSPEFGMTVDEIEQEGFQVDHRIECLLSSDTDVGMAKTIGVAILSLTEILSQQRPDLLLLIADRYEMLAPAAVALSLRIPVAHIEGGEVSEGAVDHAVRQALTSIAHLHLVPTETAKRRLLMAGEEPWRVHQVGAPSIDHLCSGDIPSAEELRERLDLCLDVPPLVVVWHPVTLDEEVSKETDPFFTAIEQVSGPIVFCFPNSDAGSRAIRDRARRFCDSREDARIHVNLEHRMYWSLLEHACAIVGNSSSGIMEAPALKLPTLNIGRRQQGRERSRCIIDVPANEAAILEGIRQVRDPRFRASLEGMINPYGDGTAGVQIAEIIASVTLGPRLLEKRSIPSEAIPEPPIWPGEDVASQSLSVT